MTIPAGVETTGIIGLIITSSTLIVRDIIKTRKANSKASSGKPPCQEHGTKIAAIEAAQAAFEAAQEVRDKWLEEFKRTNSEEHRQLSGKLDRLNGEK